MTNYINEGLKSDFLVLVNQNPTTGKLLNQLLSSDANIKGVISNLQTDKQYAPITDVVSKVGIPENKLYTFFYHLKRTLNGVKIEASNSVNVKAEEGEPTKIIGFPSEDELAEGIKNYNKKLSDFEKTLNLQCAYVQSGCKDKEIEDRASFTKLIIMLGKSGMGKTYTLEHVLQKNGMKENVDYYKKNGGSVRVDVLYDTFYKCKKKLLILDDCPANIFSGDLAGSFFKKIAEEPYEISTPASSKYYDVDSIESSNRPRQMRYYMESGNFGKTVKQSKDESDSEFKKRQESLTSASVNVSSIPNRFKWEGVAVIILNATEKKIKSNMSDPDSLDAIMGRAKFIDVSPSESVFWNHIKTKIREDAANSALDANREVGRLIPKDYVEDFIKRVEGLLYKGEGAAPSHYKRINYRSISIIRKYMMDPHEPKDEWYNQCEDRLYVSNI